MHTCAKTYTYTHALSRPTCALLLFVYTADPSQGASAQHPNDATTGPVCQYTRLKHRPPYVNSGVWHRAASVTGR